MDATEAALRALMGPGTSYITLAIKDPCLAAALLSDLAEFPEHGILTPIMEHEVMVTVVSADVEPCGLPASRGGRVSGEWQAFLRGLWQAWGPACRAHRLQPGSSVGSA